jgi:hypothetical protein
MPFAAKPLDTLTPIGVESRIRRAARKRGLRAVRSRWEAGTDRNQGGWQIIRPTGSNGASVVAGRFYELSAIAALRFLESA